MLLPSGAPHANLLLNPPYRAYNMLCSLETGAF